MKYVIGFFIILFKVITFGIFAYDFFTTKKLLNQDKTIRRQLSFFQQLEVYFFNIYIFAQLFIPFSVKTPLISLGIHIVGMIVTYWHLNRWVFVSKRSIICRDELYRVKLTYKIQYEKHTLSFKSGGKTIKIKYPLVTKKHLEDTIL